MKLDLDKDWGLIRKHFKESFPSNIHVSAASLDEHGHPTVTPVGSFFLNNNTSGHYFEKYISRLKISAQQRTPICILAVNSGKWFWFKSLLQGRFKRPPAIRLTGQLGTLRQATQNEMDRWHRRVRLTRGLKGDTMMWRDMAMVREVTITGAELINLGEMTRHFKSET